MDQDRLLMKVTNVTSDCSGYNGWWDTDNKAFYEYKNIFIKFNNDFNNLFCI